MCSPNGSLRSISVTDFFGGRLWRVSVSRSANALRGLVCSFFNGTLASPAGGWKRRKPTDLPLGFENESNRRQREIQEDTDVHDRDDAFFCTGGFNLARPPNPFHRNRAPGTRRENRRGPRDKKN